MVELVRALAVLWGVELRFAPRLSLATRPFFIEVGARLRREPPAGIATFRLILGVITKMGLLGIGHRDSILGEFAVLLGLIMLLTIFDETAPSLFGLQLSVVLHTIGA